MLNTSSLELFTWRLRFFPSLIIFSYIHFAFKDVTSSVFLLTAVILANLSGFILAKTRLRLLPFSITAFSIPWLIYLFVSMIATNSIVVLFDTNTFFFLPVFYWSAFFSYVTFRSKLAIRIEILLNILLFTSFFLIYPISDSGLHDRPIISLLIGIIFCSIEYTILYYSNDNRNHPIRSISFIILSSILISSLILVTFENRSTKNTGGLLKASLFDFDFSKYLQLESEISLNDDLVMIVKKPINDQHILLRRYVLSGYNPKTGFSMDSVFDEKTQPLEMPNIPTTLSPVIPKQTQKVEQKYYFINFDPSAFIAINQPVEIHPYSTLSNSSFSSVYTVTSLSTNTYPFELDKVTDKNVKNSMTQATYDHYTNFGNNKKIKELAQLITQKTPAYAEQVKSIYEWLKYGEYKYSLKPGIASDGDQLGHFLFSSKKGYCSYFAFSMTLMLRSLGIPSRVALGFYLDPNSVILDYYPIRSGMAHAWVEVYYADYGWIEYDPTSASIAPDEISIPYVQNQSEQYESLISEIITNEHSLSEKPSSSNSSTKDPSLKANLYSFLNPLGIICLLIIFFFLYIIYFLRYLLIAAFVKSPREKTIYISNHVFRQLYSIYFPSQTNETTGQWIFRLQKERSLDISAIFNLYQKALYSRDFSTHDYQEQIFAIRHLQLYIRKNVSFMAKLKKFIPLWAHKRLFSIIVFTFLLIGYSSNPFPLYAIETNQDDLLAQSSKAIESEHWDYALELLSSGRSQYPKNFRFPLAQGDLYAGKKLYSMAWEAYQAAEILNPDDPSLLLKEATTASHLNKDIEACTYLQRVFKKRPDDREIIADLAWAYYKLHRSQEGIILLLDAIDRLGPDSSFSMTLGTLYSDIFQYEQAKKNYLDAINQARRDGETTFEAVAHYNLSILEARYYHYDEALNQTSKSLLTSERASGHLARGELYLKQLAFSKSFSEYAQAYKLDSSPLSKIGFAQAYLLSGNLDEAHAYAEQALSSNDLSWMHNYGTDEEQQKRDTHEILKDIYMGYSNSENFILHQNPLSVISSKLKQLYYRVIAEFHSRMFRYYSQKIGLRYMAENNQIEAYHNLYDAVSNHPKRTLAQLEILKSLETTVIPQSRPIYTLEESCLKNDPYKIMESISALDPLWERKTIETAYAKAIPRFSDKSGQKQKALEELFLLNRGGLLQRGFSLPISLKFEISPESLNRAISIDESKKIIKKMTTLLDKSGFHVNESSRFLLSITIQNARGICILTDRDINTTIASAIIPFKSLSNNDLNSFFNTLSATFFKAK